MDSFVKKVIRASAGTGKTYRLSLEYISLLLRCRSEGIHFSEILVITFTKKATAEIRDRIFSQMHRTADRWPRSTRPSRQSGDTARPEMAADGPGLAAPGVRGDADQQKPGPDQHHRCICQPSFQVDHLAFHRSQQLHDKQPNGSALLCRALWLCPSARESGDHKKPLPALQKANAL